MGKKIAYGVIASILALVVGGCRAAGPAPERVYVEAPAGVQVEKEISVLDTSGHRAADYATIERLVIRNAYLDLVVPDTEAALDEINGLVD